jgi:hypothetical protein
MLGKVYYYIEPPKQVSSPHLQATTLDSIIIIKLGLTLRNKPSLLRYDLLCIYVEIKA